MWSGIVIIRLFSTSNDTHKEKQPKDTNSCDQWRLHERSVWSENSFPREYFSRYYVRPVFLAIEPAMPVIEMVLTATAVIPELIFGTFLSDRCYLH